ncbi:MAG TPA: hypothetical protein QF601_02785 [Dehalococcoidia bacterium]|nr:hypothetical protein [Dehalococcoidia bacterium]
MRNDIKKNEYIYYEKLIPNAFIASFFGIMIGLSLGLLTGIIIIQPFNRTFIMLSIVFLLIFSLVLIFLLLSFRTLIIEINDDKVMLNFGLLNRDFFISDIYKVELIKEPKVKLFFLYLFSQFFSKVWYVPFVLSGIKIYAKHNSKDEIYLVSSKKSLELYTQIEYLLNNIKK